PPVPLPFVPYALVTVIILHIIVAVVYCRTKGCSLTDRGQTLSITAHRGGSVLLPCSCTELRAKPETFTWRRYNENRKGFERIPSESDQYRNRVQLVNDHSPGNLSLLISHLTEEDGGVYRCDGVKSGYTYIRLTVEEPPVPLPFVPYALVTVIILHIIVAVVYCRTKGCTLKDQKQTKYITAYTGESVLLPCYCKDLQSRPEKFSWKELNKNPNEEISSESGRYRNRVQLGNDRSPGNLSLLISHLTEEDGGEYRCTVDGSGYRDIRLTVEGCSLTDRGQTLSITAHRGGSVLLPCSCTELRAKPETFTWKKHKGWEEISSESDQYRNRVQLVNDSFPGNLSLLISHLTEEDGGVYRCDGVKSEHTDISLTVEGTPSLPPSQSEPFIYAAVGGLLLLMVLTGIICWRYRARRWRLVESCESKSEGRRDQETQDDSLVLYATVNKDTSKEPQEVIAFDVGILFSVRSLSTLHNLVYSADKSGTSSLKMTAAILSPARQSGTDTNCVCGDVDVVIETVVV
ncbi:hypothetical protein NFI96_007688, partial [Prochilodus magdalenae]